MKYQHSIEFELPNNIDTLVECLRYAQVLSVDHDTDRIRVHCPAGIGRPDNWADSNIQRLASFRITAEHVQRRMS